MMAIKGRQQLPSASQDGSSLPPWCVGSTCKSNTFEHVHRCLHTERTSKFIRHDANQFVCVDDECLSLLHSVASGCERADDTLMRDLFLEAFALTKTACHRLADLHGLHSRGGGVRVGRRTKAPRGYETCRRASSQSNPTSIYVVTTWFEGRICRCSDKCQEQGESISLLHRWCAPATWRSRYIPTYWQHHPPIPDGTSPCQC